MKSREKVTVTLTRIQARMLSGAAWLRLQQLSQGPERKALERAAENLDDARRCEVARG